MTISFFNTLVMNYCVQYNLFYPAFVDPDIETIRVSVSLKFAVHSRSYRKVNNTGYFFTIRYIIHIVFVLLNLLFGIPGSFTDPVCPHPVSPENENLLYCRCRPCSKSFSPINCFDQSFRKGEFLETYHPECD